MNILAIDSSGDQTSVCVMLDKDVISFSSKHERKDRPNWNQLLSNIGHKKIFQLDDIDLFAYANSENSYTATRSVATYLKAVTVALDKPLVAVLAEEHEGAHADKIAMAAKQQFENSGFDRKAFDPDDANPVYTIDTQYKKIND